MIKTKITCPLGSVCERVVDGAVERCAWFVELQGVNPQTGAILEPTSKCAIYWQVYLQLEGNGKSASTVAAIVELRNIVAETPKPVDNVIGIQYAG